MPVRWLHPNPDGHGWAVLTYVEEVARNTGQFTTMDPVTRILTTTPAPGKYKTWIIVNLQPDGICMNCRNRPGLQDPIGGYYSCDECRERTRQAIAQIITLRAAA